MDMMLLPFTIYLYSSIKLINFFRLYSMIKNTGEMYWHVQICFKHIKPYNNNIRQNVVEITANIHT